jgi:ABC-2 type transport system permease protein
MIGDLKTVMWKEWRSLIHQPGSRVRVTLTAALPVLYFGIYQPLQSGADFVTEADPWFIATVLPLLTVIMTAPDSFAGERERKTLRTLLATRLSDSAILWAKILFSGLLAIGMTLFALTLALIAVNTVDGREGVTLIAADRMAYMLSVAFLLTAMATGAAVLISLRSVTVQQAQQYLAATFFLIPMILTPVLFITSGNGDRQLVEELFRALGTPSGRMGMIAGLGILAASLLLSARVRFKRSRLAETLR